MKPIKKELKSTKRRRKSKAVQEKASATNFRLWIGVAAKGPMNPNPRFTNEDQLWEKDVDCSRRCKLKLAPPKPRIDSLGE
jgi:hypothetical protein